MRARRGLSAIAVSVALAAGLAAVPGSGAQGSGAEGPRLKLRSLGSFDQPTYVTQAPGEPGTVYVVEQPGRVVAIRHGRRLAEPFLDIAPRVHSGLRETPSPEAGLYSIAFDPEYPRNRRFYVVYTGPGGANFVDAYRRGRGPAVFADPDSRRPVLKISHPYSDTHNGGQLQFGPDGMLWIGSGDGGCCGDPWDQSRSLGTLLGKLLRIDPRGGRPGFRAPPSNPLVGRPGPDAIYSWGLRNPWRFSFDRLTGNLAIADVGDDYDEIDYLSLGAASGANFGWSMYEGYRVRDPARTGPGHLVSPVQAYGHRGSRCAITGGYVVRDPKLPQLYGRYLYADYCGGRFRSLAPPPLSEAGLPPAGRVADDRDEGLFLPYPTSFGEGLRGQIYVASQAGPVHRVISVGPPPEREPEAATR
jgi:glucose/arabinose dehydrogenase